MNIDLHKIKSITFVLFIVLIVAIICPGILFVFTFGRELFIETDTFKLVLLSISVTFPIWALNTCIFSILDDDLSEDEWNDYQLQSIAGGIFTIPVVYLPILFKIFVNLSLQIGVGISMIIEFIIITGALYIHRKNVKKSEKNKKK